MGPASTPAVDATERAAVADDFVPRRSEPSLELDLGDGLILYDDRGGSVTRLDPAAEVVWRICDGHATAGQIAAEIADAYSLAVDEVGPQVTAALGELVAAGLVEDARELDASRRAGDGSGGDMTATTQMRGNR